MHRPTRLIVSFALLLPACAYISDEDEAWRLDPDGDEVPLGEDCDDSDPDAAAEVTFYTDADGDGFGAPGSAQTACRAPAGSADNEDDCDDGDPDVFPGARDVWYDGVDADCAGNDDQDQDGDGYGVESDCDDTDPNLSPDPSVAETWFNGVDDNCDNTDGDGDQDGDTYWAVDYVARVSANGGTPLEIPEGRSGDCWDDPATTPAAQQVIAGAAALAAADVNPGAAETWYDGADQDCLGVDADEDGVPDDFDQDADGHASATHPDGAGQTGFDCDDTAAGVNPDAVEVWYDGVDADCGGEDDYDADGDLYRSDAHGGDDCDDGDAGVNPGAFDFWYDGLDADCGGEDDYDADGDGDQSADWGGFDCDDDDATISSTATDIWYDGVDQDCSGGSDYDADGDGHDSSAALSTGDDCDDTDAAVHPGATEVCDNGVDDDCDGLGIVAGTGEICELLGDFDSSDATMAVEATGRGDWLGGFVDGAADVDGDGRTELVLGATQEGYDEKGYVVGFSTLSAGTWDEEDADWRLNGRSSGDGLGAGVAAVDMNGDGYDDMVVGADERTVIYSDAGAVYLLYGPMTGSRVAETGASAIVYGSSSRQGLGDGVWAISDQDGDGLDDVVFAAPGGGFVGVFSEDSGGSLSSSWPLLHGGGSSTRTGESVSTGDVDGDGVDDILVGAPGAGAAYLVHGPVTSTSNLSSHIVLAGSSTATEAGAAVVIADDLDGDGAADLVVGAPGATSSVTGSTGLTYVISGGASTSGTLSSLADLVIHPTADTSAGAGEDPACGTSLSAGGDLDGDGQDDLVVGCHEQASLGISRAGSAWLFYGPTSTGTWQTGDAAARLSGDSETERIGTLVQIVPDHDGDGVDDLLLGAPRWDDMPLRDHGRVLLFPGGSW